ncbi:MAG: DsbA family oxidoreductase [Rhodocyclaceae bacterium]|nr:DsbA family oxidoreductase [Rhodocyclaceae bacterium]
MLTIEIVSDVVCPWCFIGKRRLETALAMVRREFPDFACQTIWRPFFLNPDTPPAGEPYLPFLVNKFGSREKVEELFDRVREAGKAYGLDYAFEKIALRANTLKAHRLLHWAQAKGNADALIERLFAAQFQRGEAVGDPETLVKIATECGYDAKELATYLASDRDADIVRQRESEARHLGITMIPTFILGGKQIIVGAEDPAILAEGIRRSI